MKTRYLLCEKCKKKIREVEAKYKSKRRKLKIKKGRIVSGKVKINYESTNHRTQQKGR